LSLALSFVPTEDTAWLPIGVRRLSGRNRQAGSLVRLLFGRQPLLHQTPVVRFCRRLDDVDCRYRQPRFSKLHSRHRDRRLASGLASNAFRRSAARSSGMHATPAPFFTLSSRGCTTCQFRVNTTPSRCPLAVPPPHFGLPVDSRRCLAWSELPLRTHSFRSFSDDRILRLALFSRSSGLWAVLRSGCNPLTLSRRFTSSHGTVRLRNSSCLRALEHPVLYLQKRIPRHFRRSPP